MVKQCYICTQMDKNIDWKNADVLRRFMSPDNKILPRKNTGCCAKHQRYIARAIKRARMVAIVPYVTLVEK